MRLNGDAIDELDERGERIVGDTLLVLFNAGDEAIPFSLPETGPTERWETLIDTADPWAPVRWLMARDRYRLHGQSMTVLRLGSRERDLQRAAEWGPMGVY